MVHPKHKPQMDFQINKWVNENDLLLIDIKLFVDTTASRLVKDKGTDVWERLVTKTYIVLYEPQNPDAFDYAHVASEERLPPIPLKAGAVAPTIEVTATEKGVPRLAMAMAGVFGVPEGFKLNSEDNEPALVPLFSPDLELSKYGKLFGNVEKKKPT